MHDQITRELSLFKYNKSYYSDLLFTRVLKNGSTLCLKLSYLQKCQNFEKFM